MNLVVMNFPESPDRLAAWLEQHLVGLELGALVAELSAAQQESGPTPSVNALLGPHLSAVLAGGLSALPEAALRQLLRHPRALLELQELVLVEGGPYWDRVSRSPELAALVEAGARRLPELWAGVQVVRPALTRVAWYRRPMFVSLATAAAVLLAVFAAWRMWGTVEMPRPGEEGPIAKTPEDKRGPAPRKQPPPLLAWGWNRPDALPANVTSAAYLNRLADGAREWFKKRPEEAPALAKRIGEFRAGCSRLIFATHKPLPPEEQRWLQKRCRLWGQQIDQHLVALENGRASALVREEMDATVRRIIEVLRTRAESLEVRRLDGPRPPSAPLGA